VSNLLAPNNYVNRYVHEARHLGAFLLLGLFLALTSCTIPLQVELNNATGEIIVVRAASSSFDLSAGEVAIVPEGELQPLAIQIGQRQFTYRLANWPLEAVEWRGWALWQKRVFAVKVDAAGLIWAVGHDGQYSFAVHGAQPPGFPVEPLSR
jgi:hypothetical protein